jgi:hypothetical protein
MGRGATLDEFVRGLTGQVTREDAKRLARLHGHPWKRVLKAMKARARMRPTLRQYLDRKYGDPPGGA